MAKLQHMVHRPLQAFQNRDKAVFAGRWYQAALFGDVRAARELLTNHSISVRATMTESNNWSGGHLVPSELDAEIVRLAESRSIWTTHAKLRTMTSDIKNFGSLLTEVDARWEGETEEIDASDPEFGAAESRARKLTALTKVSSELDEDSLIDLADELTVGFANAIARKIDLAGFSGDGSSTYGGITGLGKSLHANAVKESVYTDGSLSPNDYDSLIDSCSHLDQPEFYCHPSLAADMVKFQGGNLMLVRNRLGEMRPSYRGFAINFVPRMPRFSAKQSGDDILYFGDLHLAGVYAPPRSTRTEMSTNRYFESDQVAVKVTFRAAIAALSDGENADARPVVALRLS